MGLITDIQPPDIETRLAILRKKAQWAPVPVPEDVLEFIATHIVDNIRELEGALTRVSAFATLYQRELGVSMAEQVLSDILGDNQSRLVTTAMVLDKVSRRYGFSVEELKGKSRRRPLSKIEGLMGERKAIFHQVQAIVQELRKGAA
jgi:chromosomal replication initiator protein